MQNKQQYLLDEAGKLYAATSTSEWGTVYRVSAYMRIEIDSELLQKALDRILPRFPTMNVQMKSGLFLHYLEENTQHLKIEYDKEIFCAPFQWKKKDEFMLRVFYNEECISVEFFHVITDGVGAMIFLKTLVADYLYLCGISIPPEPGIPNLSDKAKATELENAYNRVPFSEIKKMTILEPAYHFPGKMKKQSMSHVVKFFIPISSIKKSAKLVGVTLTEYIVSAMLLIGYTKQKENNPEKIQPVRISIPVDMRQFLSTESLRNFSSYVMPFIEPRSNEYTFEEIAQKVHKFMKAELRPENMYANIASTSAYEKKVWVKYMPLAIKNFFIRLGNNLQHNAATMTLTNLGQVNGSNEMMKYVERFEAMLGPDFKPGTNCAMITSGGIFQVIFTTNQEHPILPYEFQRFLNIQGIPFKIYET